MLKISELNGVFKEKRFFIGAKTYNKLLVYTRGLARMVDAKDSKIRNLTDQIEILRNKYSTSSVRDPKTGRYKKIR